MSTISITGERTYLRVYDGLVTQYSVNTGNIGRWLRAYGVQWSMETFIYFDVSPLIGQTLISARIDFSSNVQGTQIGSAGAPCRLIHQKLTNKSVWVNAGRQPKYDDFPLAAWPTADALQTITVQNIGNYSFVSSPSILAMVDAWRNVANNNGCVLDAAFNSLDWYLSVSGATLVVEYSDPTSSQINKPVLRGVEIGILNSCIK